MAEKKEGISFVIDRVEALRVRIESASEPVVNNATLYHWSQLCVEALTELTRMRTTYIDPLRIQDTTGWDRITGLLALPADATMTDVVTCVQLAVKRLAELELRVAQQAEDPTTNERLDVRVSALEERVRSLEAATIAMAQGQTRRELERG